MYFSSHRRECNDTSESIPEESRSKKNLRSYVTLRGYRYEAKLALPNGTSWIGICAAHERHYADIVQAHKARLCKRLAEEYQIPGKARGGVSPF